MKSIATLILCCLIGPSILLAQLPRDHAIYAEISRLDSLLFQEAFNQCRTEVMQDIVATDFEFYHDQSGITTGKQDFIRGIENNICGLDYRPLRKLVDVSNEVHLLKSNGVVYGALQNGVHEFYAVEGDREPYLTSTARFTHLWIKEGEDWLLTRVLSYAHRSPE